MTVYSIKVASALLNATPLWLVNGSLAFMHKHHRLLFQMIFYYFYQLSPPRNRIRNNGMFNFNHHPRLSGHLTQVYIIIIITIENYS